MRLTILVVIFLWFTFAVHSQDKDDNKPTQVPEEFKVKREEIF